MPRVVCVGERNKQRHGLLAVGDCAADNGEKPVMLLMKDSFGAISKCTAGLPPLLVSSIPHPIFSALVVIQFFANKLHYRTFVVRFLSYTQT